MFSIRRAFKEWQKQYRLLKAPREGEMRAHRFTIDGIDLVIRDHSRSLAAQFIAEEMRRGCYRLDTIPFSPGDIVIDIGAHVGIFSCYLAKRFPFVTIYAFEPVPMNFANLLFNLKANKVAGVRAFNNALTRDGRTFSMEISHRNSGGAGAFKVNADEPRPVALTVSSRTLDSIFEEFSIDCCRLLKIDCEGGEYEILMNTTALERVEHLRGEFHGNRYLEALGYSPEKLLEYCGRFIGPSNIAVEVFRNDT